MSCWERRATPADEAVPWWRALSHLEDAYALLLDDESIQDTSASLKCAEVHYYSESVVYGFQHLLYVVRKE